jgi:hypothetical protein
METILIILIIILIILVIALLAIVAIFMHKFLKLKSNDGAISQDDLSVNNMSPEVMAAIKDAKESKHNVVSQFCVDHPELYAKGVCAISDQSYCELCITKEHDSKIARKYLNLLLDEAWEDILMINNEQAGANKLNELIRLKKLLWDSDETPVIAQKQFKINIENDQIEAYTIIKSRKVDHDLVISTFSFLNS